jgi:hypothetical protein
MVNMKGQNRFYKCVVCENLVYQHPNDAPICTCGGELVRADKEVAE